MVTRNCYVGNARCDYLRRLPFVDNRIGSRVHKRFNEILERHIEKK